MSIVSHFHAPVDAELPWGARKPRRERAVGPALERNRFARLPKREVGVTREKRGDLQFVFLGLVRASGIDKHATRGDTRRTGVEDVGLQLHKGGEFFLVPVPPRVGTAAKDASIGARRIDKHLMKEFKVES